MLEDMEQALGVTFTSEQRDIIINNYTESARITACAGAGKTSTVVALLYHLIHAGGKSVDNILCTSFTREATKNIERKYVELAHALKSPLKPKFITMDAYCREIIMNHYEVLGFEEQPTIIDAIDTSEHNIRISEVLTDLNVPHSPWQAKYVAELVRFLDSSMIFDETTISNLHKFQKTGFSLEVIKDVRVYQYQTSIYSNSIDLGNLGMYALAIILTKPSIGEELRRKNEILIVDESQDYSLMKLEIAKQIASKVIVCGDIRQQIYSFNGAHRGILSLFDRVYPHCDKFHMTQSFRNPSTISAFANNIIKGAHLVDDAELIGLPDKEGSFKVTTDRVAVVDKVITDLREEYSKLDELGKLQNQYMFLFRNNNSAISLIHKLYTERLPFITNSFVPITKIRGIKDFSALVSLLLDPTDASKLGILKKFVPEFYDENKLFTPVVKMKTVPFYDIRFEYTDSYTNKFMNVCRSAKDRLYSDSFLVFIELMRDFYFRAFYGKYNQLLDWSLDGQIAIAKYVGISTLTLPEIWNQEADKAKFIKESESIGGSLSLFTIHAAKGLEADVVCIIDAEEEIMPSRPRIEQLIAGKYYLEAANQLRDEFNLAYVAATRTRRDLYILYKNELAKVFEGTHNYDVLEEYLTMEFSGDKDVELFVEFVKEANI